MISAISPETWATIGRLAADHLWQSTLLAGAIGLLILTLRSHRASVRHRLWLTASVKFLVPFALFVSIGSHLGWRSSAPITHPAIATWVETASQPFSQTVAPVFASPSASTTPSTIAPIRALLADRFKLAVHRETRELPIYALVVARRNGEFGPNLHHSVTDCVALIEANRGRPMPGPPQPGDTVPCGVRIGPGDITIGGASLSQFATSVSRFAGRVVQDRTGLAGLFDLHLRWMPDELPPRAPGTSADQPIRANGVDIDPNGPSIFTAVQEQLGLKLESQKGPVEVVVIDRVEHPVPN